MKSCDITSDEKVLSMNIEHGLGTDNVVLTIYSRIEESDNWESTILVAQVTETHIKFELAESRYVKINMIATN